MIPMKDISVEVYQTPGEIACNLDDIKAGVAEMMKAYEGLEVTEENIPERKADLATLRKIVKAIEEKRKEVKRTWNEPYDEFAGRVKEVTDKINEQITRIDSGISEFEKARVKQKRAHVQELYDKQIGEYARYLPLKSIYGPKWDNKTCSDNEIIADMQERVMGVKRDLEIIGNLHSPYEERILKTYEMLGLSAALDEHNHIVEAERAVEKRRAEEAERLAQERAKLAQEAPENPPVENTPAVDPKAQETQNIASDVWTIRITGREQIEEARGLLTFNGITFEEV
jgi:hypothetical protein